MTTDGFIKVGFWSQLVLLFLVDWGTILALSKDGGPWYHVVGFVIVNAVLLYATWLVWKWLKPARSPDLQ